MRNLRLLVAFIPLERRREKGLAIVPSAFVAHTGWHWTLEQAERLRQFAFPAVSAIVGTKLVILMVAVEAVIWVVRCGNVRSDGFTNRAIRGQGGGVRLITL